MKKLEKRVSAVLVAAGSSTRMGFDKLSFDLGGETVLHRSIRAFEQNPLVTEIVLVAGKNRAFVEQQAADCTKPVQIVTGGTTRAESAKNGVLAAAGELVAVHDAARPFVSQAVITAALEAAARGGAAAPAVPVKDTIKAAARGNGKTVPDACLVYTTPDRSTLYAVQTPQCFDRAEYLAALEELDADAVADGGLSAAERQLDELDAELARQIERLERQRRTIAEIKRERSLPDMPKRGARLMEVVRDIERDAGRAASVDTTDRAGMLLAAHLYDNAEFDEVMRIFTAVRDRGLSDRLYTIGERCDALAADAPQSERDELVDEAFALLSQVVDCLDPAIWLRDYNQVERFIDASARKMMNPAQIEVSDRVEALLEQRVRDRIAEAATG